MGISGRDYDRFAGPDFTPNKDRKMAEWRTKKDAEHKESLAEKGREETSRISQSEEKPEIKEVLQQPITKSDPNTLNAINNSTPGGVFKRPNRRKKPTILHPTLFDEVE